MKTIEQSKNEIAKLNNFDSFEKAIRYTFNRELLQSEVEFINKIIDEAMTEYAESKVKNLDLCGVVRSLLLDKPTETGWLFNSDLLRTITHKANRHDPLISMEQVEYVLRAIADKQ